MTTETFKTYYPEMGEARPEADGYVSIGFRGERYITTKQALKGRGVKHVQTYTASDLRPGSWKVGFSEYRVTPLAYENLRETMSLASEALL